MTKLVAAACVAVAILAAPRAIPQQQDHRHDGGALGEVNFPVSWIHAYDFPSIAEHGLDVARRYASIAPDSPHALHMPS